MLTQCIACIFVLSGWAAGDTAFSITGQVKHPLILNTGDLNKFQTVRVRMNNIDKSGTYQGVFDTQGVPLKHLLDICGLQKEDTAFSKPVDLAILVRNSSGKQIVLSWGEVFYKNPANVSIAFAADPVNPHHGASSSQAEQLKRKIHFPKLIVAGDYYADRSLEGIVNIEVVNLQRGGKSQRIKELYSPEFNLIGTVEKTLAVRDLSAYPRTEIAAIGVGEGKGYEGTRNHEGVSLVELLTQAGVKQDLNMVIVFTAPDGYRSLISYGELFLSAQGKRIVIADREQGELLKRNGKFMLVLPDDLHADRYVKAVSKIETVSLKMNPKLYIIGVGPGDTNLITPEALSYLGKTDAIASPEDIRRRFAKYLEGKDVLFDPMPLLKKQFFKEANPRLAATEIDKAFESERVKAVGKIKDAFAAGKNVAFLDWGDPLIFGSSRWIKDFFTDAEIETVPSISAFNVANAVVDRDVTCGGSVILTAANAIENNEALVKAAAANGDTLAVFMGLKELKKLIPLLNKYYKDSTPISIAYNAGISRSEQLVRSTLKDILSKTDKEQEKNLGMIYIGPCLDKKSSECH
jgi:precorrin-4 methylase